MLNKFCLFSAALIFFLTASVITDAHAKELSKLTFVGGAAKHPTTVDVFEPFIKKAAEQFSGKLAFTYYPMNSLFKEEEAFDVLNDGRADFARIRAGSFPGKMTLMGVIDLPGMAPNAVVGSLVAQELMDKFPEVAAEFPKNARPFTAWASASYQIHSVLPITSPAELAGKKILVWDAVMAEVVSAIGAVPVRVVSTDSAKALAEGLGDAVICPLAPIRAYKITDVAKYHTMLDLGVTSFNIMIYKPLWNSMPKNMQGWLSAQGGMKMALELGQCLENTEAKDIKILKEQGHQFFIFSAKERGQALKPLNAFKSKWLKECVAQGVKKPVAEKVLAFTEDRVKFHSARLAGAK